MDIEKKGALKNIMRGLFVSERQGDVVSSISMRDVSSLFSKSYEYEEYVEQPIVEEVPSVSRNTVQNRYSKIGKTRRLEKVANDILKTLLDLRTFENNKRDYEDSLRNYHSIVEARRHKEIMEVFQKEINNETFRPKQLGKSKSSKSLLLGGLALGAVALLLPLKSFAKEIEDELNEKDLNNQIDDLNNALNLEELERQFSEFDDLADGIPDEEVADEKFKLDSDLEKATNEIEKLQSDIDKTEIPEKVETGTAVAGSATGTAVAGSATSVSTASNRQVTPLTSVSEDLSSTKVSGGLDEDRRMAVMAPTEVTDTARVSNIATPLPPNGKVEAGTAVAGSAFGISTASNRQVSATTENGSAQVTSRQVTPLTSISEDLSSTKVSGGLDEDRRMAVMAPTDVTGTARVSNRTAPLPSNEQIVTGTSSVSRRQVTPFTETGTSSVSRRQVTPFTETGTSRATNIAAPLPSNEQIVTDTSSASSRNRVGFARLRPDESAVTEVSPSVTFGGFPYKPTLTKIREEKEKETPASDQPTEKIKELIKVFEGFRAKAYPDHKQWSIGYGTKAKSEDEVIDKQEANKRFEERVKKDYNIVINYGKKHKYNFTQNQADALTSFVYNLGTGILKQLTNDGKRTINEIQEAMLLYNKASGSVNDVLAERRRLEVQFFEKGEIKPSEGVKPTYKKTTSDVKPQTSTGQRVGSSSSQNRDSKRQAQQSRPAIVIQNNNNTVINNRNTVNNVSAPRQQNNNPNMRQ